MVTFWWCGEEVGWHTFYNIGASHIDDCRCIAMTEPVVPCFDIGNLRCIEACIPHGVVGLGRGNDLGIRGGNGVQVSGR